MPDPAGKLSETEKRLPVRFDYRIEASSTNDLAASPEYEHGDVIWVENQTKGRGQRGNSWSSEEGKNLTFSLVLKPGGFPAESQFYISKIISLGLIEALREFEIPALIKWPNDIYIGDRKVAGILIENDLQGVGIVKSIAGIGLNVNQDKFDPVLPNPISMRNVLGKESDRITVLEKILEKILYWYDLLSQDQLNKIDESYMRYLYRNEGVFQFQEPGKIPFEASIHAVRPSGELILEDRNGNQKGYFFKEVEFIIKTSE